MPVTTNLERKYIYRVSRGGAFLGVLQNVVSEFSYTQDINTAGAALQIEVGESADKQFEQPSILTTEDGAWITDEFGVPLTEERAPDIVGNLNSRALIRNNNDITVYEISPDYPNGKIVFNGWISRWKARFGGGDSIIINCLSNGSDLDNYLIDGGESVDISQISNNTPALLQEQIGWNRLGQKFTTGATVNNLSAIILKLEGVSSDPVVYTLKVWSSEADYYGGGTPLGTATRTVSSVVAAAYQFTFSTPITVSAATQYFFSIQVETNTSGQIYYQNTNIYAGGGMWASTYSGGSGGGGWVETPIGSYPISDLYFQTIYTSGVTSVAYSSSPPESILGIAITSYIQRGGSINYDDSIGSRDATGVLVSYTFKLNTILEVIKKLLELSPSDFYWYVDPATDVLYFKETSATAQHAMVYGRHVQSLEVEASVEEVKNRVYFTGGDVGSNVYLFQTQSDTDALAANAGRVGLERMTDNRVTLSDTADALMQNFLDANKSENYQTTITVNAKDYDITLLKLGQVVGFESFGNFVDNLLLQIVHVDRHPDFATLGLGLLPRRASAKVEQLQRDLNAVETIYNPTTPS